VTLNGKLIENVFYSGCDFEIGLDRYGADIFSGELRLEILPLPKDAPVFFEPRIKPDFGTNKTLLKLQSMELVRWGSHFQKPIEI
jgi:hypothetical protein